MIPKTALAYASRGKDVIHCDITQHKIKQIQRKTSTSVPYIHCESKKANDIFVHTFVKCWPFLKILSPLDSARD